jgi:hypothetical protein
MREQRKIRIFIHRTGKFHFDYGTEVMYMNFPFVNELSACNCMDLTSYNSDYYTFKHFAEIRSAHDEQAGLYIDEELLKKENMFFCSFLLNLIDRTIPKHPYSPGWESKLIEICSLSEEYSKLHFLIERNSNLHKTKKEQTKSIEPKEKYMRIVDL